MQGKYKKAIKLAAAAAIAASAFVSINPAQSEAASSVENLVLKAEQNKVPLIRATSVEYNADAQSQPWDLYNKAKNDYAAAKKEVAKLKGKQKEVLSARLDTVKLWIDRTAAYIDAISTGNKLSAYQEAMEQYLAEGDMEQATTAYHKLSYEIKKSAVMLYRVYGQSTRAAILEAYKLPAEAAKEDALYPVSIQVELDRLEAAMIDGDVETINGHIEKIADWFEFIEDQNLIDVLNTRFEDLLYYTDTEFAEIVVYKEAEFITGEPSINAFDLFGFRDEEGNDVYPDPVEAGLIIKDDQGAFNEDGSFSSKYEETGFTETGSIHIQMLDKETGEVVIEHTFYIVDGNELFVIEDGKIVDSEGIEVSSLAVGGNYQFIPTEAVALNGLTASELGVELSLADFEGVIFESLNPEVFTVNNEGMITPVAPGTADLNVEYNGWVIAIPVVVE